jgi:hypothetical protein
MLAYQHILGHRMLGLKQIEETSVADLDIIS